MYIRRQRTELHKPNSISIFSQLHKIQNNTRNLLQHCKYFFWLHFFSRCRKIAELVATGKYLRKANLQSCFVTKICIVKMLHCLR